MTDSPIKLNFYPVVPISEMIIPSQEYLQSPDFLFSAAQVPSTVHKQAVNELSAKLKPFRGKVLRRDIVDINLHPRLLTAAGPSPNAAFYKSRGLTGATFFGLDFFDGRTNGDSTSIGYWYITVSA